MHINIRRPVLRPDKIIGIAKNTIFWLLTYLGVENQRLFCHQQVIKFDLQLHRVKLKLKLSYGSNVTLVDGNWEVAANAVLTKC